MEIGAVKQAFNNEVILLKKRLNQAKTQIIHKLTRKAKTLAKKKVPDALKEKNKKKAESAVNEVLIIKKIKAKDLAKFIVIHKKELKDYLNTPIVDNNKACARLLLHKSLEDKYRFLRGRFANMQIKDLFMSREERRKLKKEERDKKKKKNKAKAEKSAKAKGEWNVEDVKMTDLDKKINDNIESFDEGPISDGVSVSDDASVSGEGSVSDNRSVNDDNEVSNSGNESNPEFERRSDDELKNEVTDENEDEDFETNSDQVVKTSPIKKDKSILLNKMAENKKEVNTKSVKEDSGDEETETKSDKVDKTSPVKKDKSIILSKIAAHKKEVNTKSVEEDNGDEQIETKSVKVVNTGPVKKDKSILLNKTPSNNKNEVKTKSVNDRKKKDKPKNINKNKKLNEKILLRKFKKNSEEEMNGGKEITDSFFLTSTNENYKSLVLPREPDEFKEIHKEGNRKLRRAIMFGRAPKPKRRNNYRNDDGTFNKTSNFQRNRPGFNTSNNKWSDNNRNNISMSKDSEEKLHPSWEAKRRQSSLLPFQGKKIVFDDS